MEDAALGAFLGAAVGNAVGTMLGICHRISEDDVDRALRWESNIPTRRAPGQVSSLANIIPHNKSGCNR